MSPSIQAEVRAYVLDPERGRPRKDMPFHSPEADEEDDAISAQLTADTGSHDAAEEEDASSEDPDYIDMSHSSGIEPDALKTAAEENKEPPDRKELEKLSRRKREQAMGRVVDVVLSDMSEPWDQTTGFGKRSISDAYLRMMNTSGNSFRDHAGSMVSGIFSLWNEKSTFMCWHSADFRSRIFAPPR